MTRINEAFGQAVRELLDAKGLSLRQARIRTGVDIDTLGRMRAGDVPRIDKIIDFARGFGLDVNHWLELAGYPRIEETDPDRIAESFLTSAESDPDRFTDALTRGLHGHPAAEEIIRRAFPEE